MRKRHIALTAVIALLVAIYVGLGSLGLSPTNLIANIEVGTGMGAKLACSGRYISGFEADRIKSDLISYTSAYQLLDIDLDDTARRASVSLLGSSASASFRPGIGCSLDIGDTTPLDTLDVSRPGTDAMAWPRGSLVTTLDDAVQAQLVDIVRRDNAQDLDTRALLVVRNGQIVAEAYAPGYSPQTPFLGWSMGKSLTAIMLGKLELDGQTHTDTANLFPQWQSDDRAELTLAQLLQMSSGLEFSEVYAPGSDATHMLFNAYDASSIPLHKPLVHEPGAHFSYSSCTTNLLARYYVKLVGGSQAAYDELTDGLLRPLGLAHTFVEPDPSGVFVGSSYVYASGRDWARLGLLMVNGGTLNGHRLLSEDWVRRATTPNTSSNDPRYGYQFWLNAGTEQPRWKDLPDDAYAMQGNRSQVVMMIPSANTVSARLVWIATAYPTNDNFAEILSALATH